MNKHYKIPINGTQDYVELYNGIFDLSPTEIEIIAEFINIYKELEKANVDINVFSTDMKKRVAKRLERDDFNTLNNYIKSLCEKGAISKTEDGYNIHSMLTSMGIESVTFSLNYDE